NGPDHVDDQRTTMYVVSPIAAGGVQHERYSTAGLVRTIEIILGLPPLSVYDASANPLYAAFDVRKRNAQPFDALPARVDLSTRNATAAYRAKDSAALDFEHADAAPAADLNDIIWHAVKGANAKPPPFGRFSKDR
ncbi:MAG: hypothetical protein GIX03_11350, partial [Candidatus Eremiobacteraeota bacterium]|nr:hypothetical protein [Candidatus Eremiobacteraeota bacterium]